MSNRARAEARTIGRKAEEFVKLWLRRHGELVLDDYDPTRAPPVRPAAGGDAPDLLSMRDGHFRWWHVLWKGGASFTRSTGQWETGLDANTWHRFANVEHVTGYPVWLLFLHQEQGEALAQSLAKLEGVKRYTPKFGAGGMYLFPCSALDRVASYEDMVGGELAWHPALMPPIGARRPAERIQGPAPDPKRAQLGLSIGPPPRSVGDFAK